MVGLELVACEQGNGMRRVGDGCRALEVPVLAAGGGKPRRGAWRVPGQPLSATSPSQASAVKPTLIVGLLLDGFGHMDTFY